MHKSQMQNNNSHAHQNHVSNNWSLHSKVRGDYWSKLNWKQASDSWSLHSKGRGDLKFQADEWQLASLWQREGRLQCDLKRRSNCWILVSTRNWREVKLLKGAQLQASKRLCSLHSKRRGDYYLKQATVGVSTAKWGESIEESSIASK